MPDSFEIGVEVNLTTNKSKFFDNIVKTVGDMRPIDIPTMLGKQALKGVPLGQRPRVQEEGGDWRWLKESEIGNNLLRSIQSSFVIGLGVLTGIFGVLKKVPSILQASLKLMGIGFLLILKPMADLLGIILMPIAKGIISLARFLLEFKKGAGVGGLLGMIIATLAIGLLAILTSPGTTTLIAMALVAGFVILAAGIIGSILGAIAEYSWDKLIDLEKGIVGTILEKVDGWLGLPEEGFWGKITKSIENWIKDDTDKRSFFTVLTESIFGGREKSRDIGAKASGALIGAGTMGVAGTALAPGVGTVIGAILGGIAGWFAGGKITEMATGGIVTSPTRALIGEAGPEAVIPLNQLGSFGGTTININGIVDEYKFRDIIKDVVRQENTAHYGVTGGSI